MGALEARSIHAGMFWIVALGLCGGLALQGPLGGHRGGLLVGLSTAQDSPLVTSCRPPSRWPIHRSRCAHVVALLRRCCGGVAAQRNFAGLSNTDKFLTTKVPLRRPPALYFFSSRGCRPGHSGAMLA